MEQKLTKEIAQKLMRIKGEARGITLKTDWSAVLGRYGKEGLKKLEDKMAELGHPLKYGEIKTMDFYPIGLDALSISAIKEVFGLDEKGLQDLGAAAVKFSLFLKIIIKYFFSLDLLLKEVPRTWQRHYTVGDIEVIEFNEKEKYVILGLKNFVLNKDVCACLKGYFSKILEMAVKKPATCEETKCVFKGDQYHEFLLKWQ